MLNLVFWDQIHEILIMFQTLNFGLAAYLQAKISNVKFSSTKEMLDPSLRHWWRLRWYGTSGAHLAWYHPFWWIV
jgi:hypothetical protein